jgi:hypothetical protein
MDCRSRFATNHSLSHGNKSFFGIQRNADVAEQIKERSNDFGAKKFYALRPAAMLISYGRVRPSKEKQAALCSADASLYKSVTNSSCESSRVHACRDFNNPVRPFFSEKRTPRRRKRTWARTASRAETRWFARSRRGAGALRALWADFSYPGCCRSSVVEHAIGNGEVDSSILSGGTSSTGVSARYSAATLVDFWVAASRSMTVLQPAL